MHQRISDYVRYLFFIDLLNVLYVYSLKLLFTECITYMFTVCNCCLLNVLYVYSLKLLFTERVICLQSGIAVYWMFYIYIYITFSKQQFQTVNIYVYSLKLLFTECIICFLKLLFTECIICLQSEIAVYWTCYMFTVWNCCLLNVLYIYI